MSFLPARRPGTSILEIVVAMAMLTAALVPIVGLFSSTANQTAQSKAEAAAATHAASVMNTFLDKISYDHAILAPGTHLSEGVTDPDIPGNITIDGTELRWTMEVHDFKSDQIKLKHWRIRFSNITDCPPAPGGPAVDLPAFAAASHIREVSNRTIFDLDSKAGRDPISGAAISVLKEIKLTIQWKTPRDPTFETLGGDERKLRRSVSLITRRARLRRKV
jgi:hypothetical protein